MNFSFLGQVYFEATTLGHTITSAGQSFHNSIYFQGMGGGWTLQDSLTVSYEENYHTNRLYFVYGNLNTNSKVVRCPWFYSNYPGNPRTLTIDHSEIKLHNINETYDRRWEIDGSNLSFNATGSTIYGRLFYHFGEPKIYWNVSISGNDIFIYGGASTYNKITMWPTEMLWPGRVYENNKIDSLVTNSSFAL